MAGYTSKEINEKTNKYFENFCVSYNQEFYRKHNYALTCGLYDDITADTFKDGIEHPISNFSTEADVFIIKHITDKDISYMPNVVERLKQQYSEEYELIQHNKSRYDTYYINYSKPKIKLIDTTSNKTLRHIKREHWDRVYVLIMPSEKDRSLYFNNVHRIFYNHNEGCKYYKYFDELGKDNQDDLLNMSIKRIYKYITRTQLHKGTLISLRCYNEDKNRSVTKEGYYLFEVIG